MFFVGWMLAIIVALANPAVLAHPYYLGISATLRSLGQSVNSDHLGLPLLNPRYPYYYHEQTFSCDRVGVEP